MIEVVLALAVLGVCVFAGVGFVMLKMIPRLATPERHGHVRAVAAIVLVVFLIAAITWAPAVETTARKSLQDSLHAYCSIEGEQISRIVENVEGLYVLPPPGGRRRANHYHTDDTSDRPWLSSRKPSYQFVETPRNGQGSAVLRYDHPVIDSKSTEIPSPTARYALTWVDTTRNQEGNRGLFGEEVVVYDRVTGEILARRTHHYLVERSQPSRYDDTIYTCPDIDIGIDTGYIDRRPRSSYPFVSRVLIPAPPPDSTEPKQYVLANGSGFRIWDCGPDGVDLSEDVLQHNLIARRKGVDLHLERNTSPDRLICTHYFDKGKPPAPEKTIRFHDGTALSWDKLIVE